MDFQQLSLYTYCLFILTFPFSVTLSQGFAILSALSFLIDSFQKKTISKRIRNRFFLVAFLIYASLFLPLLFNFDKYENPWKSMFREEISDFWMCFVLLTGHYLARKEEFLKFFSKFFFYSAIFTLVSGLVSIFTPFRLAVFFQNGFSVPESSRLQHYAGELFGFSTYLPVGFMNTHLTFGGILGLFFIGLTANFFYKLRERPFWRNAIYSMILFLYGFLIFYNQSRSIWIGIVFALFLLGLRFFNTWKEIFTLERMKIFVPIIIIIVLSSLYIFQKNWLLQRAFQESFVENTTENQRFFIYRNALTLGIEHPIFGVGPGNFSNEHWKASTRMIERKEELWYELFITPRGHAHHDLMHFWVIGGIFSLGFFLYFWIYAFRFFYGMEVKGTELLFSGFLILFPAGFFQCYFLDDEVALPFYAFLAIFSGRAFALAEQVREKKKIFALLKERKSLAGVTFQEETISLENALESFTKWFQKIIGRDPSEDKKMIAHRFAILTVFFPTLFSLFYIFYLVHREPENVYRQKIWVRSLEEKRIIARALKEEQGSISKEFAETGFKIEGCLTHRYGNPPLIRDNPFQIRLTLAQELKNPPTTVIVTRYKRDSFDQDKMYKAHQEVYIDEVQFPLVTGVNLLQFQNLDNVSQSARYPENIFFIDYHFRFLNEKNDSDFIDLPSIDFGKLCGLD
jgi:O-antigen ligase